MNNIEIVEQALLKARKEYKTLIKSLENNLLAQYNFNDPKQILLAYVRTDGLIDVMDFMDYANEHGNHPFKGKDAAFYDIDGGENYQEWPIQFLGFSFRWDGDVGIYLSAIYSLDGEKCNGDFQLLQNGEWGWNGWANFKDFPNSFQ